ncbi:ferric reductase-like transmembrane domain-containing protein [Sphingomonas sp. HF-S3]|uniref:Ferric reductase-like transmembrane domain-containing protein n=1 Tax=Sphingomonas rustica TaxID=3103142 RepID=A0ABV0B8G6_9SPHN
MRGARKPWLIAAAAGGAVLICGVAALLPWSFEERLSLATRLTSRWAAFWFLVAFTARPMSLLIGGPWREILRQRRCIGLGFAAIHTIHAGCFLWLTAATDLTRSLSTWIGGGIAYLLIWAMAITSNDASMRALGRNWKRLHLIGGWWVWAVFVFSYSGRIAGPDTMVLGSIMTTLFLGAGLIRLTMLHRAARQSGSTP